MKATVIITCYNKGVLLKRAYESLEKQSFKNFNIILVNDCSTDETTNIIAEEISKNLNIQYIFNKTNLGVSVSKDIAINLAEEGVIITLDGDDTLPLNAIQRIVEEFERDSTLDYVYGDYLIIDELGKNEKYISLKHYTYTNGDLNPDELGKKWLLLGSTPHKKKLWNEIGGYDERFTYSIQDQDFWQRAVLHGVKGMYINEPIYNWHKYNNTISCNTPFKDYYYIKKKNKEFHKRYTPIIRKYGYFTVMSYLFVKMKWKQLKRRFVKQ